MVLGRGSFGKVYLAEYEGKLYAVKAIKKTLLIMDKIRKDVENERDIMAENDHPFLIDMEFLFENEHRIYFVMPFVRGGELEQLPKQYKGGLVDESVVKFIAAQIVLGLGYLHEKNIVHRDLKPANIVIDLDGYIKIIDFGIAAIIQNNQELSDIFGTPIYYAPEIINKTGVNKDFDWWCLGIMIYKLLFGQMPFWKNKEQIDQKTLYDRILTKEVKIKNHKCSDEAVDLIKKLLEKDKTKRLGSGENDYIDIIVHPFFSSIDLSQLQSKELEAPFKPKLKMEEIQNDLKWLKETFISEVDQQYLKNNPISLE